MKAGISSFHVNFERDGTVYESSVISSNYGTAYILHFYLPQADEKFYIRRNASVKSYGMILCQVKTSDCRIVLR